jgi:hypothetical protein
MIGYRQRIAAEKRKKGAAADIGTADTSAVPGRNGGSGERFFEERLMPFGAANENSHLVETHFTFGQAKYTARDLGTLQRFAGGREYLYRLVGISLRRRFAGDHVSLQQIELRKCFGGFRREGQFEPFRDGGFERVRELLLE